jgi:CBS domain-containing protein
MGMAARDVMDHKFYTLLPEATIAEAIEIFKQASEEQQNIVFGMTVADKQGQLVGMLSMYDIFLLLRPKYVHIWGEMKDLDFSGIIDETYLRAKSMQVGDIMTDEVITITLDTHLLMIIDIMIRKRIRHLPVVEQGEMVGIVYLHKVFHHLLKRLAL